MPPDGFNNLGANDWAAQPPPLPNLGTNDWLTAAPPTPEPLPPKPTPPSSTLGGMVKAGWQVPTDIAGGLTQAAGAMVTSAGTAVQSGAKNAQAFARQQTGIINRIDAGEAVAPMDDPLGYADASADQRATIRHDLDAQITAMPAPEDTGLGQVGGAIKTAGGAVMGAGAAVTKAGEDWHPLTEEEQQRFSVKGVKMVGTLVPYLGAAIAGGLPGVVGLAGVQGFGSHYEAAKKAGSSDEDAAISGTFGALATGALMTVPIGKAMEVAAALPNALKGEFLSTIWKIAESGVTMVAFSQIQAVADNVIAKGSYAPDQDLTKGLGQDLGLQFAVGALIPGVGAGMNVASRLATRFARRNDIRGFQLRTDQDPTPEAPTPPVAPDRLVLAAPDVDSAISAADTASKATPPADQPFAAEPPTATPPPSSAPAPSATWGGALEPAPDGGYQFRRIDANGAESIHPIVPWNPGEAPAEPGATTISPETAIAIRDHYAAAGVKTIFFQHDAGIPFDGVVDPAQPDTLFLSNDPSRNIAQVGGHEFTHVLATTTLPDGTNLGDLLAQQIAAGITPAGRKYAAKTFGATAPDRAGFPNDAAHAEAVKAHLIAELGADIGGEAPKFQSFIPRVIDAIQARFGNNVAADVLTKLVDGLRSAMDTMRKLFGETGTRSQNWVTNLGEIHDTLAKMYAERFGSPLERDQAAAATIADRAERDRLVNATDTPPTAVKPVAPTPDTAPVVGQPVRPATQLPALQAPQPGAPTWEETRDGLQATALQLRRWLGELADQRDAAASSTPKATILHQTEAAILRPVAGDETKLPEAGRERLDQVRTQIDEVTHPTADTPQMAKVRAELDARTASHAELRAEQEAIAQQWDDIGNAGMATAVRLGAASPTLTRANVDFNRQKLDGELAKREPGAPKPAETFSLVDFMQSGGRDDKTALATIEAGGSPEAKAVVPRVQAAAQLLTDRMNGLGFTREEAGQNRGGSVGDFRRRFSDLLATFTRFARADLARTRGHKRATEAGWKRDLQSLHNAIEAAGVEPAAPLPVPPEAAARANQISAIMPPGSWYIHPEGYGPYRVERVGAHTDGSNSIASYSGHDFRRRAERGQPMHESQLGSQNDVRLDADGSVTTHDGQSLVPISEGEAERLMDLADKHGAEVAQTEMKRVAADTPPPSAPAPGAPTKHPGLVVTSLQTGKTTHIQPPGTTPPIATPPAPEPAPAAPAFKAGDTVTYRGYEHTVVSGPTPEGEHGAPAGSYLVEDKETGATFFVKPGQMTRAVPETKVAELPPDRDALPPAPVDPAQGAEWWKQLTEPGRQTALDMAGLHQPATTPWQQLSVGQRARLLAANRAPASAPAAEAKAAAKAAAKEALEAEPGPPPKPDTSPPPPPPPERPEGYGADNKFFTADAADKARARLRAKFARLNAGFDPEMAFDGLMLSGFHVEAGARKFAAYAKEMIADLGAAARPHLAQWYTSVRMQHGFDATGMDSAAVVERLSQVPAGEVTIFRSGASAVADFRGYTEVGVPVGVSLAAMSRTSPTNQMLLDYARKGGQVFVDSGAFTAFTKGTPVDFQQIIARQLDLAQQAAGDRLHLVMPDVIGDQAESLRLIGEHADSIKELIRLGQDVMVPLQKGEMSPREVWSAVRTLLGTDDFTVAIPFNKVPFSHDDLRDLFNGDGGPQRIHLLGIAGRKNALAAAVAVIHEAGGAGVEISADASRINAGVGQGRAITEGARTALSRSLDDLWSGPHGLEAFDETELAGELASTPGFLSPDQARSLAESLGVPEANQAVWVSAAHDGDLGDLLDQQDGDGRATMHWLRAQFRKAAANAAAGQARSDAVGKHDIETMQGAHAAELKRRPDAPTLAPEAPNAAGPRDGGLDQPRGDEAEPGARRPGEPAGDGHAGGVEARPAGDVPGAGQPGAETGVRPAGEVLPGDAAVPAGGVAANGRAGAGDGGVVLDGAGGPRVPVPATIRANFHIDDPERLIGGTPKVRFARNRAAVEALRAIEEEQRDPTPEELQSLAGYIGWGSFGQDLFQGTFERQPPRQGWDAEGKWLRDHLGKDDWESAQRSIINAHYTDPPTVKVMWDMVQRMGFKGGRILEPSMGIGNFFGMMPRDIMAASTLTGIELDRLSATMAKLLYPQAGVHKKGYQDSKTPDGFYDLVIGNWPFAAQSPADRRYDRLSPTLHDYFFLKALDQTRPGGLVIGITSAGTMDKAGRSARIEMAKKGELLGAFRLPLGAFEKYAGTSVVTDILVFRKRTEPVADALAEPWINATDMRVPSGATIRVNDYFQAHPDAVLGQLEFGRSTVGRQAMTVNRLPDFEGKLASLAERLPKDGFAPTVRGSEPRFVSNNSTDRQNAVTIGEDGKLYQVQGERMALLEDLSKGLRAGNQKQQKATADQVGKLVGLRRTYGALIDAERDGRPETEDVRKALADQFQAFEREHGPLAASRGLAVLHSVKDPAYAALSALVRPDGTPSQILSEPTIRSRRSIANPSIADAYVVARNEKAGVDLDRVAELAGLPHEAVKHELLTAGAIMRAPGGGYEPKDVYLSGNVRRKLREAHDALTQGEDMQSSIDALTNALPPTVPYYQIEAKLGAPWAGDHTYKAFLGDVLGLSGNGLDDIHLRFAGSRWRVSFANPRMNYTPEAMQAGHQDYRFDKLVSAAMGNNVIKIMKKDENGDKYLDVTATEEVNAKTQALRERFQDWAWADAERKVGLENAYNEVMNAIAKPHYDGSFMDLSGMALRRGNDPFSLRKHQMDAIWRGVVTGRGLFAHEVGTGKSYTMAGIAVEGRRYGVFRKPLVFAHNANSAAVAQEFQDMYPGGKFLYIDNLAPSVIDTTLHRIANEDWDAIVMPHSLIDRMTLTRESLMELASDQITDLENEAMEAAREDGVGLTPEMMDDPEAMKKVRSITAKQLVKQRELLIANIEKQANRASREGAVSFEKLGVDAVIVDEAHEFKKPVLVTRMQLKGLNTATSARSIALDFLTGYVNKQNNGRGTFLFTGTPVTNALNEVYNMARYFMRDRMEQDGVKDWDAWFNTFADGVSDVELTAGGGYEPVKRLTAFVNVDELVRSMSEFTDVVQAKQMPEFVARTTADGKTLTSPDLTPEGRDFLTNGRTAQPIGRPYKKIVTDVAEMSPEQKEITAELQARWRDFKAATGQAKREMMATGEGLKAQNGLRAVTLDARMVDPAAPEDPTGKVNRVAANVLKHYQEDRAGQAVFVDQGYNANKTSDGRDERFILVQELIAKLVAGGIPRKEIKIVAGKLEAPKKKEIADAMNAGTVRVVIGQSGTLGVGVNMQTNLRAMHHMDAPWRPGDLEQRNGRGERQGNEWNTVLEYRYVTEGIDGRGWQVLTTKDRFIKQFISAFNDASGKRLGNIEGDAADISEDEDILTTLGQAAGDPRIMLRAKFQADVTRLERRERMHTLGQVDAAQRARKMREQFAVQQIADTRDKERLQAWEAGAAKADEAAKAAGDTHRWYEAEVGGKILHTGPEIQAALDEQVLGLRHGDTKVIATINGTEVHARWKTLQPSYTFAGSILEAPTLPRLTGAVTAMRNRVAVANRPGRFEESVLRLEKAADEGFPRQADLLKKRLQLAHLVDDLQASPVPPPGWLRHGAPLDSEIYVDGKPRIVRGHRMSDDYKLLTDEGEVSYRRARDENGNQIYEVHAPPVQPKEAEGTADGGPSAEVPPRPAQFSPRQEEDRPPFFSALTRGVEDLKQDRATPGQWAATIKNMAGVKAEERAWSGVEDWLAMQPKSVSKADLLDYLRANEVRVTEVLRGEPRQEIKWTERTLRDGTVRYEAPSAKIVGVPSMARAGKATIETHPDGRAFAATAGGFFRMFPSVDAAKAWFANDRSIAQERPTRYSGNTLSGGENYRELLMMLPPQDKQEWQVFRPTDGKPVASFDTEAAAQADARARGREFDYDRTDARGNPQEYRSSHWDERNVLAHVRFDDRTDAEGRKVLHVAEIQSDWHQAGRKQGYKVAGAGLAIRQIEEKVDRIREELGRRQPGIDFASEMEVQRAYGRHPDLAAREGALMSEYARAVQASSRGVPDAPFKTTWPELAFKRVIRYAAEHDYDRVTWDTGTTNADRFSLAHQVSAIDYQKNADGTYRLSTQQDGRGRLLGAAIAADKLGDLVGQAVAQRIIDGAGDQQNFGANNSPPDVWNRLSGLDLRVGAGPMQAFYDRMLPAIANKLGKRFGAKTGQAEVTEPAVTDNPTGWTSIGTNQPATRVPVHSIDVTDAMREGVMQGQPLFSPRITGAERETAPYTPEEKQAFANVGRITEAPTWRERWDEATKDLGRRLIAAVLDPYIGVKADDPAGYVALRNANTTSGALLRFMTDGTLKFDGSTYAMADRNGGVEHSLIRPLHGEENRFIWWVASHRAERLSAEDRENLWSPEDIAAIKGTNQGTVSFDYTLPSGTVTRSREAIYLDSLRKLDVFNRNTMDLAVEAGLIDGGVANTMLENPFYVPFYRQAEGDTHFTGASISSGFVKQNAFKTLKGGAEKLNHDLWENAIGNWAHMIDASLRNRAAAGVLDVGVTNGAVIERTQREVDHMMSKKEKESLVWVMNGGQRQFFQVTDPLLYTAISALDFSGYRNGIMAGAAKFKTLLTLGVTADPRFMLRVAIKDAEQAIAVGPMSYNVFKNIFQGFKMGDLPGALQNLARTMAGQETQRLALSDEAANAMAGGATMHLGSGHDTGARKVDLATMLDSPTSIAGFWARIAKIARAAKEVSAQSEDVQRLALYNRLIADGVPHDEAAFAGRDLEDFTLRGAAPIVRALTQTVPFLNAMMQGLYKVGRAAADADRNIGVAVGKRIAASTTRRVATVLAATTLLTLALDAIYADDEDYKKRTDDDRNRNFWFKFGSTQFRIPMGFEIAAMSRIAANGVEAVFGASEMTARRFVNNVGSILADNLYMSPVPQAVAPLVDVYANKGTGGRPIVPTGMEKLRPEQQYTQASTLVARGISSLGNTAARAIGGPQAGFLAPVQIDHLADAYFGWLGTMVITTADVAVRAADQAQAAARGVRPLEPVRPAKDLWNFASGGMISTEPTPQSRYVDMLYKQAEGVGRAFSTYHELLAEGRIDAAKTFFGDNKDLIARHQMMQQATKLESDVNLQIKRVESNPDMTAAEKHDRIAKFVAMRNQIGQNVFRAQR